LKGLYRGREGGRGERSEGGGGRAEEIERFELITIILKLKFCVRFSINFIIVIKSFMLISMYRKFILKL
jgi:hypothetical protein